ncbi:hypothetical protein AD929_03055 [Gluconobacter potus]|uniref:Uncharacterized protein n=1 Tax=Gluconobacter potus TaxID=2724927 RepID=A0A149QYF2_9PROT|nr:hypothetical protein AD929_03055 [Gluconobacter potus]
MSEVVYDRTTVDIMLFRRIRDIIKIYICRAVSTDEGVLPTKISRTIDQTSVTGKNPPLPVVVEVYIHSERHKKNVKMLFYGRA